MLAEVLSGGVGDHHLRTLAEALARALKANIAPSTASTADDCASVSFPIRFTSLDQSTVQT